jgi:hypothetical protein
MELQVLHQYTGWGTEDSGYHRLLPGESKLVLTVSYNVGELTTGRDNWIVNGTEYTKIEGHVNASSFVKINGDLYIPIKKYTTSGGFLGLSKWKCHTLRSEDENAVTKIYVYNSHVEYVSRSGKSEESFSWEVIPGSFR